MVSCGWDQTICRFTDSSSNEIHLHVQPTKVREDMLISAKTERKQALEAAQAPATAAASESVFRQASLSVSAPGEL